MVKEGPLSFWDYVIYALLALLALSTFYPFWYVLCLSISDWEAVTHNLVRFWPIGPHLETYKVVFQANDIVRAYLNSILYTTLGTFFGVVFTYLAAYPLSRPRLAYRGPIILFMAFTLFIEAGLIPRYLFMKEIGLLDTVLAVTLPMAFGFWKVAVVRANIAAIHQDLFDAARADGAGEFWVLLKIVVPLTMPILVTIALFTVVARWNDYFTPLIFLQDSAKYPVTMILRRLLIEMDTDSMAVMTGGGKTMWELPIGYFRAIRMAVIVTASAPIIILYPFVQRYFTKGVMLGSIKG